MHMTTFQEHLLHLFLPSLITCLLSPPPPPIPFYHSPPPTLPFQLLN